MLGDFKLLYGDRVAEIRAPRMQELLAYLGLHPQVTTSRQRMAFLLWPDSTESQAKTNLRQLLHRLRQTFPQIEDFLEDGQMLRWRADARVSVDAGDFLACTDRA